MDYRRFHSVACQVGSKQTRFPSFDAPNYNMTNTAEIRWTAARLCDDYKEWEGFPQVDGSYAIRFTWKSNEGAEFIEAGASFYNKATGWFSPANIQEYAGPFATQAEALSWAIANNNKQPEPEDTPESVPTVTFQKQEWITIEYETTPPLASSARALNVPIDVPLFIKQPDGYVIVAVYQDLLAEEAGAASSYAFSQCYESPFGLKDGSWRYEAVHDDYRKPVAYIPFPFLSDAGGV